MSHSGILENEPMICKQKSEISIWAAILYFLSNPSKVIIGATIVWLQLSFVTLLTLYAYLDTH